MVLALPQKVSSLKKCPMIIHSAEFVKSSANLEQCPAEDKPEYAFIGRSNVGKSSLINMMLGRKELAKTSGTPGKTQLINHFEINNAWNVVDLPGYGYAKVSKKNRKDFYQIITDYLSKRQSMVMVFVLLDCRHEPLTLDLDFLRWLGENQVPFAIAFTKIDKLSSNELSKNMAKYKKRLLADWETLPTIFKTSSTGRVGQLEMLNYIQALNETVIR
jgi:GTP-binding protein